MAAICATLIAAALWVPDPGTGIETMPLASPGWPHLLGTDRLGRDVAHVTLSAAAYSVLWAAVVLVASLLLGLLAAVISASWWKRWPDTVLLSFADAIRSFPSLVLALLFFTAGAPVNLILILYFWIPVWRVVRSQLAAQRERPYVFVGQLSGHSKLRMLAVHALPNALRGFSAIVLLVFVEILSVQAGLEFLGFTVPLSRPTLGNVTSEALRLGGGFAWVWLPAALVASTIAIGLVLIARTRLGGDKGGLE
ncbi:MAG: ABC transporter permease subunit [Alphaproteobacteria bacterium]|nr:MAG: ABC transporter permease subunit [Alphaproteobacteria bacterium]